MRQYLLLGHRRSYNNLNSRPTLALRQTAMQSVGSGTNADRPALPPVPGAFDWEAMRANGHRTIDFIVDYHKSLAEKRIPCQAQVAPNYLYEAIGKHNPTAPTQPQSYHDVLETVRDHITPGMTHWQHPDFFAFFPAMLSPPALLGDMLGIAFNQPGFNWMASPAATELEVIVTNWLTDAFGLPAAFRWSGTGGCVLQPSATESAVVVLLAAKNRCLAAFPESERHTRASQLVAYVSDQAHFCVEKAARVLSIPHFRKLRTEPSPEDGNFPLSAETLEAAIEADLAEGLTPFFVSINYGATGTCAVDPAHTIAPVCAKHKLWLNVDAAYAGVTVICEELRPQFDAFAQNADSILVNGSKWLSMSFNSSFMFFRNREFIVSSLNATGVYLSNPHTESNLVVDFKDYHLGLGRPFRALKVYSTMMCFGTTGLQDVIRRHILLAAYLDQRLRQNPLLKVVVATRFALVCFTVADDFLAANSTTESRNQKSLEILAYLTQSKKRFMVHTVSPQGVVILRISLAYPQLTYEHMDDLLKDINEAASNAAVDKAHL